MIFLNCLGDMLSWSTSRQWVLGLLLLVSLTWIIRASVRVVFARPRFLPQWVMGMGPVGIAALTGFVQASVFHSRYTNYNLLNCVFIECVCFLLLLFKE